MMILKHRIHMSYSGLKVKVIQYNGKTVLNLLILKIIELFRIKSLLVKQTRVINHTKKRYSRNQFQKENAEVDRWWLLKAATIPVKV
jgi:hypothetical protein